MCAAGADARRHHGCTHPGLVSIAEKVVVLDTALCPTTFTLFHISMLAARIARELDFPVDAACDAIGLVTRVTLRGQAVVAIDLVRRAIEAAAARSSARRRQP
jgi:hypothetical protein